MNPSDVVWPQGVFVSGSDTDVGKTWVACKLIKSLKRHFQHVGAYKPVASGIERFEDSDPYRLWVQTGGLRTPNDVCPQQFAAPLAPMYAAEREGRSIEIELIWSGWERWKEWCDFLVVEGAGGLLSPVDESLTNADLAQRMAYPLIIVVSNRLGAMNQSLLTLEVAFRRNLPVAALILNEISCSTSTDYRHAHIPSIRRQLERIGLPVPVMFETSLNAHTSSEIDELAGSLSRR